MKQIIIYTDGACKRNGKGGWGAILSWNEHRLELSGSDNKTTNNRMELQAVLSALESLIEPCCVTLYSDSQYVVKGSEWVVGWKQRGWRLADGSPTKNVDLWERLMALREEHAVVFEWVRGHNGHPENERADQLATGAIQ